MLRAYGHDKDTILLEFHFRNDIRSILIWEVILILLYFTLEKIHHPRLVLGIWLVALDRGIPSETDCWVILSQYYGWYNLYLKLVNDQRFCYWKCTDIVVLVYVLMVVGFFLGLFCITPYFSLGFWIWYHFFNSQ